MSKTALLGIERASRSGSGIGSARPLPRRGARDRRGAERRPLEHARTARGLGRSNHRRDQHGQPRLPGFLRYGFPWNLDAVPYEYLPDEERENFVLDLARLALTMSDAYRAGDKAGIREAGEAIIDRVKQREADPLLEQRAKAT